MNKQFIITIILSTLFITGLTFIFLSLQQIKSDQIIPSSTPVAIIEPATSSTVREQAFIKRVIDGDTIELTDGRKLRYIGINAPESVDPRRPIACFGKEAYEYNKKLVEGKEVEIEKDVSDTDKYGRLLRYVYVGETGEEKIFINEKLVRDGYASVSTYPPDIKFQKLFLEAEKAAREAKRGLWDKCRKSSL